MQAWSDEVVSKGRFATEIRPFLQKHCIRCHGGEDEVRGEVDLTPFASSRDALKEFELWESAAELIGDGSMPPDGEPQPSALEKARFQDWFESQLVDAIKAHPGFFRPRRLSAHEYRNTLRSVLGFDLEVAIIEAEQTVSEKSLVMKLLPTDPPGPSGFTNDTSENPLTTSFWNQASYLVDVGLEELFSPKRRHVLESDAGKIQGEFLSPPQAQRVLHRMTERAYRQKIDRSVLNDAFERMSGAAGASLESSLREELKVILMSPPFLYRGLLMDIPHDVRHRVDDYELAQRLSYFLWADIPDPTLIRLAQSGELSNPAVYAQQIDRMIASPKSKNLATDFGRQWFSLGEIEGVSDNPPIADALLQQPIDFLHYLFTADRPLLELIDSRVAFVSHHTAKFYPGDRNQLPKREKQKGIEIQKLGNHMIRLEQTDERGGLLTMPGVLAMNRGPVLRGTWILERVLGEHLPDPPANVGQVKSNAPGEDLTFRERFELHRSDATCAICHDKIDPLGFALGQYDPSGAYRKSTAPPKKKRKGPPPIDPAKIDSSGRMPSGQTFDDFEGLKKILVTSERKRVIENIVRRTLSYALCRRLEAFDKPTVDEMVEQLNSEISTYRDLIHLVATSLPFRETVRQSSDSSQP